MRLCHVHLNPGDRSELFELLIERGADVNLQDSSGRTALAHSCIAEKMDIMELLGNIPECDPNIADNDENSPLMYAVKSRQVEVVKKLLECFKDRSLDVHRQNTKGTRGWLIMHLYTYTKGQLTQIVSYDLAVVIIRVVDSQ